MDDNTLDPNAMDPAMNPSTPTDADGQPVTPDVTVPEAPAETPEAAPDTLAA